MAGKTPHKPLPDLPRDLRKHGIEVPYLRLWRRVVAGQIPAQRQGGRWVYDPADLPQIAAHFTEQAR